MDAFVSRIVVALMTSVALVIATLDPCALTCHPKADASAAAPAAHCRAASKHAATILESTAGCHHNHDVASIDGTPQSRVDAPASVAFGAVARDPSALAPIATAIGLDTGPFESPAALLERSAFTTPLRL